MMTLNSIARFLLFDKSTNFAPIRQALAIKFVIFIENKRHLGIIAQTSLALLRSICDIFYVVLQVFGGIFIVKKA